jgi:hypothetical protein
MAAYTWTLQDESGAVLRTTEAFGSKEEAEAWMGAEWSELRDEGAEYVLLAADGEPLYRMGLSEG